MVTTHYPGATPEEVESLVTREIEDALSEMDDLKQIISDSATGLSVVLAIYEDDSDADKANQQVRKKLAAVAEQLPSDLVITEVTFQPQDVERSMNHFIGSLHRCPSIAIPPHCSQHRHHHHGML